MELWVVFHLYSARWSYAIGGTMVTRKTRWTPVFSLKKSRETFINKKQVVNYAGCPKGAYRV